MAELKKIDETAATIYGEALDNLIGEAKKNLRYKEFLLAMARRLQSELHANREVPYASPMEYLLRIVMHLLGRTDPDRGYVLSKYEHAGVLLERVFAPKTKN